MIVVVVVFFTLTDRASTIPSNTRGCQSGTWSAGQKKIIIHIVMSRKLCSVLFTVIIVSIGPVEAFTKAL